VIVEDTGLYLDALNGLPGALVRWFLVTIGPAGICALIPAGADRRATARTAVALCDGGGVEVFVGETPGVVAAAPAGAGGFGWDPIFRPDGASRTFAEMDQAEKNVYSMRRQALEGLGARLVP
jgi:non-canonical purine NTP pyrophosphatase (RdgB/HAM1 family)